MPSSPDLRELGAIFAGGCAGALVRTAVVELGADEVSAWPWGTFAINLVGCLLLGYLVTRLQERLPLSRYRRPLLGTGFCGALTTFSTFQLQLLKLIDSHRYALAGSYGLASLTGGLLGLRLATVLVRQVRDL